MLGTDLSKLIRARADQDDLPEDHELRRQADAFDEASGKYFESPQAVSPKQFLAVWAKTRRVWCDYSGEPLI